MSFSSFAIYVKVPNFPKPVDKKTDCRDSPKNVKSRVTDDEVTNQSIMSTRSRKRQDYVMVKKPRKFEGHTTHRT